jgi:protein-disulfide isomerase
MGVTGTPAFIINGKILAGAQPTEVFRRVLDRELKQQP